MKGYKQLSVLMPIEMVDLIRSSAKSSKQNQRELLTRAVLAYHGRMPSSFVQRNIALARANPRDDLQVQIANIELPDGESYGHGGSGGAHGS